MRRWKMSEVEPSLDDLLDDEIMIPVMRSAGVDAGQLRAELRRAARRLAGLEATPPSKSRCCWASA
jgi:predicted nucleic acid-binding protein